MKRLLILALVIGMVSVANATLALVADVEGTPYDLSGSGEELAVGTTVDVAVVQDAPNTMGSGGEMTITMAASGGSATDTSPICGGPGSWLSEETSVCCWDWGFSEVAFLDNSDGTWFAWFGKSVNISSQWAPGTPGMGSICGVFVSSPYYSTMEFSFLVTETTELVWGGTWDGVNMNGVVGGIVNVEPCACYGDVTGDNQVSIADLSAIVGLLSPAYAGTTPPYTVCPAPEVWECADVTDDGCISIADLSAIVAYLAPAYSGTTPPYTGPCMPSP